MPPTTLFAAAFLASELPPMSETEWMHGVWALLILLVLLVAGTTVWKNLKPDPSVDEKIQASALALERRIDGKLEDLKQQVKKADEATSRIQGSLEAGFRDVQRALGRLEGKLEEKP